MELLVRYDRYRTIIFPLGVHTAKRNKNYAHRKITAIVRILKYTDILHGQIIRNKSI